MQALVAVALFAAAVALGVPASPRARLSAVLGQEPSKPRAVVTPGQPLLAARAAAVVGGLGVALLVGGVVGVVIGVLAGVVAGRVLTRLEPRAARVLRERAEADMPIAVDLLAGCLLVGRPPAEALRAVGGVLSGPLAEQLDVIAARLALGTDPVTVWRESSQVEPLAPLGRAMTRSLETGAPLADVLGRLADDLRRKRRASAEQRARSVGVRAAAPLGLCFLPAFLLIGVVPAVVSAFSELAIFSR